MANSPESTDAGQPQPDAQPDRQAQPVDTEQPPRLPFPVVGIGASAGGLEAFMDFLSAMPADSGMAFVLIQHLSPDRESMIAEILSRKTSMPVLEVTDEILLKPNHVYVIRPGNVLTIKDGRLHLGPILGSRAANRPIDEFFKSLAEEQRERAIGIVMSGMGSNGTAGAQALKAVGGLCIAQDPDTAHFPSMPRHLIDQGYADYILTVQEMPEILLSYAGHPYARADRGGIGDGDGDGDGDALAQREQQQLRDILAILRTRTRQDFSGYKKPTVYRRIQRRMGLTRVTTTADYAKLLRQSPTEVSALADDLLIHVTGFFRDADAWEALRQRVVAPLIAAREPGASIRCWVTACSSGEEAYTLAMLLVEEAERGGKPLDIKVFATDMADRALAHARAGVYPGGIESEISPERLERFFEKEDAVYRIRSDLRESVIFAPQNVLQDPPFSRLDIASCRNLLIHLEPEVQQRVLGLLHFGLREGGALFLGSSETVNGAEELFDPIDKKARIYRRVGATRRAMADFPAPRLFRMPGEIESSMHATAEAADPLVSQALGVGTPPRSEHRPGRPTVAQVTHRVLLERHTPAAVTVDRDYRVLYYHGNTRPFLDQPTGEPTRDLLLLTRDGLRAAVRQAIQQAAAECRTVSIMDGWTEVAPGHRAHTRVTVSPADDKSGTEYFVISFQPQETVESTDDPTARAASIVAQTNDELRRTRDELQMTIEELQTSNEELKASHEEVMSMNEELQSANEELETSKEEMQSLNEELTTVNSQLRLKMEEAQSAGNDMSSLLASTDLAVLFLDTRFRIRRYTPAVLSLIEMISSDIGRPLSDLARKFTDPNLVSDAEEVLARLMPIEREIEGKDDRWFLRRITPYRTVDNRIEGVVITFFETTLRRRALAALELSERRLRRMMNIDGVGVLIFDSTGRLIEGNDAFRTMTGYGPADIADGALTWQRLTPSEFVEASERQIEQLETTGRIGPYEKQYIRADGSRSWMLFAGASLGDGTIIEYCIDVSDRKRTEAALAQSEARYRALVNATSYIVYRMSPDWSEMRELDGRGVLRDTTHPSRTWIDEYIVSEEQPRVLEAIRTAVRTKSVFELEHRVRRADGTLGWTFSRAVPLFDETGEIIEWFGAASDITPRRDLEHATADTETRFRLVIEGSTDFAMILFDEKARIVAWNAGATRLIGYGESEVTGTDGEFIFTPEDRAAGAPEHERYQAVTTGRAIDERWHMRKDGTRFWGSGVMNSLRTAQGTLRGFLKIMRDETSRKQTENALQNAKAAAEEANRVKDEFLATLSHELRTPLSSILIWSKLLRRRGDAPPEYVEAFDAITKSAEAQKQLIDDLLDTSRITAGKLRLNMRPTDLAPLIRNGIEAIQPTADAKNVTLEVDLSSNVGIVQADPDRLRQVVWNLLANAVKFTPSGGTVNVRLSRRGRSVEIRVSDSGRGIDPSFLPHVFEPFRQAESASTRSRGGLGLGLSICKQLVEQHGGTITAESAGVDKGSIFTVELPLPRVRTRGPEAAADDGSVVSPVASLSLLDGKRILLVEDEPATRTAFATLLSDAGANVTAVESVEQALTALSSSPRPTLLITDIAMAGADGYELIRQVRAMKGPVAAIPAVALTAFARAEDRDKALSSGFDRHVGKPVDPERLLSVLRELLDERLS